MNRNTGSFLHAAIIGAGPYGLSLAAHLREAGVPHRIFGRPMHSWATQMPVGMKLKSDGFASNLSAGSVPFTLEDFARLTGRPYHATAVPIALEDFIAYGQEFAHRFVPELEEVDVTHIESEGKAFRLTLETGESFLARHVILATGVSLFSWIPPMLRHLPASLVSHTADHRTFEQFRGREVLVLGRGASSLNAAVILNEIGSHPTVVTRSQKIHIHRPAFEGKTPLWYRLRHPSSPLGESLRSWLSSNFPGVFQALPAPLRRALVYKHLGPAGGSTLQGRIEGRMPILRGWSVLKAEAVAGPSGEEMVRVKLANEAGERREITTSHIISGTGYRTDLDRYRFLAANLRASIHRQKYGAPVLSRSFETSVPGLYLVGPAAAASFGPLLRFAAGAGYAATQVTNHLAADFARIRGLARPSMAVQAQRVRPVK
ncbi:NAD(P)-binding domain-containing protein [Bryocella elongata]|uniref:NAD(P)-binding domain-containing protein n=1 Tax=Bryocella elongata TaxID=863522 RepID=UPI00135798BC|nr:NAD(P)-binding domain-containing protein [Bryocella elongata]